MELTGRKILGIVFIASVFMFSYGCSDSSSSSSSDTASSGSDSSGSSDDSSGDSTDDTDDTDDTSSGDAGVSTTLSITGTAVATSADVAAVATLSEKWGAWFAKVNPFREAWAAASTGAAANQALPGATVTLYKVFGEGAAEAQVDIGTVTTDSSGDFSIANLAPVPDADSSATDFYYEVRIAKDTLELRSPSAPGVDSEVNVSPESDLAAKILSDVVAVPGESEPPIPSSETIEAMRELVIQNAGDLIDDGSIDIPTAVGSAGDEVVVATANGVASNGGNSEKMFKTASFESEYSALVSASDTTDADAAGYIQRVTREGCGQESGDYMPQTIADALGAFFNSTDNTVTPTEIVAAYNTNFGGADLVAATVVSNFAGVMSNVEDNLVADADEATDMTDDEQLALFTMREMAPDEFAVDTELKIDQAMAFIQTLVGGVNNVCQTDPQLDLFGFIGDLIGNTAIKLPIVANVELYHNSGFGCNEGSGEGHFYARVSVYEGLKTVSSVVVTSSDSSALGGDGTETLALDGGAYVSNTNAICVALGTSVTYTVTATFSDTTTVTKEVVRNHPRIPEASSMVLVDGSFVSGADNSATPTVVTTTRPLYQWTSPSSMLTSIVNDASNTAVTTDLAASSAVVKYTYEFSHVDTGSAPVSPASSCPQVSADMLYSVDSFMPTEDCDVSACATALGVDVANIACRMNIQSYYVNENDSILGQAAGHFRFFCVDTDDDGNCG